MTKEAIATVLVLYNVKEEIIKQKSISKDLEVLLSVNYKDAEQTSFQKGKLAAYDLVLTMINEKIEQLKVSSNG